MIKLPKDKIFNNEFITTYQQNVKDFVFHKRGGINFFHHSFSADEISSGELINCISMDPFSRDGLNSKNEYFLKDYYEFSNFLLYSNHYLNIIKTQFTIKKGSNYKKNLMNERVFIINKFRRNDILKHLGIDNPSITKNEKNYLEFHNKIKGEFKRNNANIAKLFDYNDFMRSQDNIRNNILENIKVIICPYCNRQYIDIYSYEGKVKSIAQIDHFFPKSIFPLYSLSLLNFVPSCSHCNCIIKKDKLFPWVSVYANNPLDEKYFYVNYHNVNGLYGDTNSFNLRISPQKKEDINNSIFFRHQEIYENHKDEVSVLLKKRLIFNEGYKNSIEQLLSNKITEHEFKFMIFGVTGNDSDYLTIPLSKLKNDILKS
ncbi:hypothetical protein [Halomonas sp. hl-4]|uniref:hypothetical protein n=1 Tax=Halomonas sp. hl-4 TaxID=1761789 RepID=UPI000BB82998|nr:hypothetical protein [Halomonas sp. hl-4]SNY97087.1 hypothetical protein SAMN04488142_1661 [Halomonas sp. hl-4]